ncbi:MAG: DEAD/DEAH box helicase [Spirochaetes bacterium]|nr:DEAD/DEAH box helicase [Spirochaetota bacterium]
MTNTKFKELGLSDATLAELDKRGFEEPTEIQEKAIPVLLTSDTDIICQAQTGTGKTAAFGLPLLDKLSKNTKHVQALILTPTRELAIQVAEEINSFRGKRKFQIIPVYGGQSITDQLRRLEKGVDIVVGTPGRIFDHIKRKSLSLDQVSYVILDEADEMLNMGFIDEVEDILKHTNPGRRTLLFSATMPERIVTIAKNHMREYKLIAAKKGGLTVDLTDQIYFEVSESDKFESMCRIIDMEKDFYGLIFCRTKVAVDELSNRLNDRGYESEAIHGDLSQSQRERILDKFKKRRASILVATDVAARGIDVSNLTHVINYSLPQDPEAYVHRIGRTGRAGKKGVAITFISPWENKKLKFISNLTKTAIRRENVPSVSDIIKRKIFILQEELKEIINVNAHQDYIKTALQLVEENDPLNVLAAMLKYSLEEELDEKKYKDIKEPAKNSEASGKGEVRLFVSFGKKDGISPRKLLKLINNETRVPAGKISNIKVMDSYSFLSVPLKHAEIIVNAFKSKKSNKKPVIEVAADSNKKLKKNTGRDIKSKKKKKNRI